MSRLNQYAFHLASGILTYDCEMEREKDIYRVLSLSLEKKREREKERERETG